jgi:hypothetical protein
MDKLKICKEDFEASKQSFQQVRGNEGDWSRAGYSQ